MEMQDRQFGGFRGFAYLEYESPDDAASAIEHLHQAQVHIVLLAYTVFACLPSA